MAVTAKTIVYCDLSRGYFVASKVSKAVNNSPFHQFFSKDLLNLEIYPLVENPISTAVRDPFSAADLSGIALTLSIYSADGSTLLATQSSFTPDANLGILTGQLDCNTANMASYVTSDSLTVIVEGRFTGSFGSKNVRANPHPIRKQLNSSGSPSVLPLPSYYTREEINGLLLSLVTHQIEWVSPDGTKRKLQYLGNDDSMHFDEVT